MVLVFFINPIGAPEVDPGRIDFKPGDQPIHNTQLTRGVSISNLGPTHSQHPSSRGASNLATGFYRTRPTLIVDFIGRLLVSVFYLVLVFFINPIGA